MGTLAAVAGATNSGLGFGNATFAGKFMRVYATVIIGGASVHGGRGSVIGTLFGVLLVGLINQAMVYLKIPTSWGDAFLGIVFIAFTISQTLERRNNTQ
jgi:ribose/xylose/arabinose/galactoside ABC-type transport system permease subunit